MDERPQAVLAAHPGTIATWLRNEPALTPSPWPSPRPLGTPLPRAGEGLGVRGWAKGRG